MMFARRTRKFAQMTTKSTGECVCAIALTRASFIWGLRQQILFCPVSVLQTPFDIGKKGRLNCLCWFLFDEKGFYTCGPYECSLTRSPSHFDNLRLFMSFLSN